MQLEMITKGFLEGSEEGLLTPQYKRHAADHRKTFTILAKELHEAKFEHYLSGTEQNYYLESRLVESLQVGIPNPIFSVPTV